MNKQAKIIPLPERPAPAVEPSAIDAAWLKGFLSEVVLDEFQAIGHLEAHWGKKVTIDQLRNWRKRDKGPKVLNVGRAVLYAKRDLDIWAEFGTSRPVIAPPIPPEPK